MDATGTLHPVERLLKVFTCVGDIWQRIERCVFQVLKDLHFDMAWIIGQCYDDVGNMRGRYSGLGTLIQNECKKAVYVWLTPIV